MQSSDSRTFPRPSHIYVSQTVAIIYNIIIVGSAYGVILYGRSTHIRIVMKMAAAACPFTSPPRTVVTNNNIIGIITTQWYITYMIIL